MAKATKKTSAVKASTKSSATEVNSSPAAVRFETSLNKIKSTGSAGADKIAQAVVRRVFNREMKLEGTVETINDPSALLAPATLFSKALIVIGVPAVIPCGPTVGGPSVFRQLGEIIPAKGGPLDQNNISKRIG